MNVDELNPITRSEVIAHLADRLRDESISDEAFSEADDSDGPLTGVDMNENSKTIIPGANFTPPHVETGLIEHLTPLQEAQRAAREAEKQSTKRTTSND